MKNMSSELTFIPTTSDMLRDVDDLLDKVFGPGRYARMAERLREGNSPIDGLSYVAMNAHGVLIGSIVYYPIRVNRTPALLLGPLAVLPDYSRRNIGYRLMTHTLERATQQGHCFVILVGDASYYQAVGFSVVPDTVSFPYPVDSVRLLMKRLQSGDDSVIEGVIRADRSVGYRDSNV